MPTSRRPAAATDQELSRAIHHAAYRDVVIRQFGSWDETAQDRFFDDGWSRGDVEIIHWNDAVAGYCSVQDLDDQVFVRELVIAPGFQNRGIGTDVLRTAMVRASDRGVQARLTVLRQNRAAGLYRRLGFRECGTTDTHIVFTWP